MRKTRRFSVPLLLFLLLVSAAPAAAPKKKAKAPPAKATPVKYGVPRLAPGQLWVSSVPPGLEVRIGENPMSGKVVGRTPVVVGAADVEPYVTVVLLREDYGADLPSQFDLGDFSAKTSHSASRTHNGKHEDFLRGITYKVKLPDRRTVIALFQPRSLPLSQAARLFPRGSNFAFSDPVVSKLLAEKGVNASSIPEGLALLHRGGKVLLQAGGSWVIAEVTAPATVEVIDYASALAASQTPTPAPERTP